MTTGQRKRRLGAHAAWKGRHLMWAVRCGTQHVATHAALTGRGYVARLACGGATTFGINSTTWYGQKNAGKRVCRKCSEWLAKRFRDAPAGTTRKD